MEQKPNRDMRMQGFVKTERSGHADFFLNSMIPMRVHGLILFGTTKGTTIHTLQLANENLIADNVPGHIFDQKDVVTFEEAQRMLEQGGLPLLRRQAMQGVLDTGCTARLVVTGPCDGAALYCELMGSMNCSRQVTVIRRGEHWTGSIQKDTLRGMLTTLDIEAPTEDAIMQAIVAGLGGVRVRVG